MPSAKLAISKRIKDARTARGLTQVVLSEQLHLTRGAIGHWEQGKASPSTANLSKLATVLNVPIEWLIRGGQSPFKEAQNSRNSSNFIGVTESPATFNNTVESFDKETMAVAGKFFRLPKRQRKVIRDLLDQLQPN